MIQITSNRVSLAALQSRVQATITRLPPLLGAEAVRHTKENFRMGGFQDQSFTKWPARKGNTDPGRGVLIGKGTGHLFKDIRILSQSGNAVTVGTTLPYAGIHNEGGTISHPGGTAFFKKGDETIWVSNNIAARMATAGRNLPRTKPHPINIKQRRFLGKSVILGDKLKKIVRTELRRITAP